MNAPRGSKKAVSREINSGQAARILENVAASISEAVFLTDTRGEILWASPKANTVLHRRIKNFVGLSLDTLSQPLHQTWQQLSRLAQENCLQGKEIQLRGSRNTTVILEVWATPLAGNGGAPEILWVLKDRTAERKREAQIQAEKKNVEEFVYTVSHDLKAPLVSIEGYLSLLREENFNDLGDEGKYFVEKISKNVRLMRRMIQDLLELSRIGREAPSQTLLAVGPIIQEILEEFRFQIEKKQIDIVLAERFPRIRANSRHIRLLFSNLVSNAIKFLGEQPDPRIEIGWERADSAIRYFVKDNGMGISPRYHDQIFRLFYRPKTGDEEGSGIGLAIVKKIVEEHGGTVSVESEEGRGATFFVAFPKPKRN